VLYVAVFETRGGGSHLSNTRPVRAVDFDARKPMQISRRIVLMTLLAGARNPTEVQR
jgi:hypothetical protein